MRNLHIVLMIEKEIYDILDEIEFYSFRDSLLLELQIELGLNPSKIQDLKFSQFNLTHSLFFDENKNYTLTIRVIKKLNRLFRLRNNGYLFQNKGSQIELNSIMIINNNYIKKYPKIKPYFRNQTIISDNKKRSEREPIKFDINFLFTENSKIIEENGTKLDLFLQLLESIEDNTKSIIYSITSKDIMKKFQNIYNLHISVFEINLLIKHMYKQRKIEILQNPKHYRYFFENKKYPGLIPGELQQ